MADTFTSPLDLAELSNNGSSPSGYARIAANIDGNLYSVKPTGESIRIDDPNLNTGTEIRFGALKAKYIPTDSILSLDFAAGGGANINPAGIP